MGGSAAVDGFDTLAGGAGNDSLMLGLGDRGIGGEGDDLFQIDNRLEGSGSEQGSLMTGNMKPYHGDFACPEQIVPSEGLVDQAGRSQPRRRICARRLMRSHRPATHPCPRSS